MYYLLNAIAGYIVVLVTPITNVLPIIFVLAMAAIREIIEDVGKHRSDKYMNETPYEVIRNHQSRIVPAKDIRQGDILKLSCNQLVPCDSVLLQASNPTGIAFVSTANLDGEINLKPRSQILKQNRTEAELKDLEVLVEADLPNHDMLHFNGQFSIVEQEDDQQTFALLSEPEPTTTQRTSHASKNHYYSIENVLLSGVKVENTATVYLAVVFTGMQTRIMQSQTKSKPKNSRMNVKMTKLILYQGVISILLAIIFPGVTLAGQDERFLRYISYSREPTSHGKLFLNQFIIYFILLAYLLPISLAVTLEFQRLVSAIIMELDHKMYADDVRKYADENKRWNLKKTPFEGRNPYSLSVNVKNSVSIENMQELDIIFSDKTGTLTKNQMVFHSYADASGERKLLKENVLAAREMNEYVDGQIDPVMLF